MEAGGQLREQLQIFAGGILRHQQYEYQRHRLAVGRVKFDRIGGAHKGADRLGKRFVTAVGNGHALPQAGTAELFAGEQAVEHRRMRQATVRFQKLGNGFKQPLFTADLHIEHDIGQGQNIGE